jgi:ABC-type sugar transport system ATPase subunit
MPINDLIAIIAGRSLSSMFPKTEPDIGDVVLEVKHMVSSVVNDVSFLLHEGEILGLCGLMGAGRTEIARALYGLDKLESGEIMIQGKPAKINTPRDAIRFGIGMITEDRLVSGTIQELSVKFNMSIAYIGRICDKLSFIDLPKEHNDVLDTIYSLDVKVSDTKQAIKTLSGGNQQKIIIGRWLLSQPRILILDEPTRGIDVGAKSEIHRIMNDLVHKGVSIIMISSELPEILGMSDRIMVIRDGYKVGEYLPGEVTQEDLMRAAFGVVA